MRHAPQGWLVGAEALPAPATVPANPPRAGFRTTSPCLTPPATAASRSEVFAPRTRAPSSAARPQPESLIEGGVASIIPMKRNDIPALLVSAPALALGTAPPRQLDRPTAPAAASPSPRWRSFPLGPSRAELGPPRRPQKLFGQAVGAASLREAVPSHSSPRPGPVLFCEGRNPRFLLYTI
jgi:hypothetical protein